MPETQFKPANRFAAHALSASRIELQDPRGNVVSRASLTLEDRRHLAAGKPLGMGAPFDRVESAYLVRDSGERLCIDVEPGAGRGSRVVCRPASRG